MGMGKETAIAEANATIPKMGLSRSKEWATAYKKGDKNHGLIF